MFLLQIARNITTNEMANAMRYTYLRGPGGRFRNPYDHGVRKNCTDFFIKGYSEDIERPEEPSSAEEIGMLPITRNTNLHNGECHNHHSNGSTHVCSAAEPKNSKSHINSSHNNHNNDKTEKVPLGLGFGLGRNNVRHNARSILAS